jgi:hypothetical protein
MNGWASCVNMNGFYMTPWGQTAVLTHSYNDIALVYSPADNANSLLSKCTGVEEITVPFNDGCCKGTWNAESRKIQWKSTKESDKIYPYWQQLFK